MNVGSSRISKRCSYDNALLALAYAEAWQVTKRRDFARVLRTTLDYVLREMTSPEGGFFSATDADSQGEEGTFSLWSADEIRQLLGDEAERFIAFYGVTAHGNVQRAPSRAAHRSHCSTRQGRASGPADCIHLRTRSMRSSDDRPRHDGSATAEVTRII